MKKSDASDAMKVLVMTFLWLLPYRLGEKLFWFRQLFVLTSSVLIIINSLRRYGLKFKDSCILKDIFFFGASTVLPSILVLNLRDIVVRGIFTLEILGMFCFFKKYCRKNIKITLKSCAMLIFIYFLSDLKRFDPIGAEQFSYRMIYFTGGKFDVGYNMILLLFLLTASIRNENWKPWIEKLIITISIGFTMYVSYKINSMTVLLGITTVLVISFWLAKTKKQMTPRFMLGIFILTGGSILVMEFLLNISIVQNIITTILHREISLTGRMDIYKSIFSVILRHIWFGNGRTTTYATELIGYSNLQNGLFQIIYLYGIFGAVMLCNLMYTYFKAVCKLPEYKWILAFVFGYMMCAVSEIVFDYTVYYYFLAISYALVTTLPRQGVFEMSKHIGK